MAWQSRINRTLMDYPIRQTGNLTTTNADQGSEQRPEDFGAYLDEADVLGVAAEALPAAHEPVLPDEAVGVGAHTAAITHRGIH